MTQAFSEIFEKLNEAQRAPVLDTDGYVLVIAGAGSGKTRVLTSRIAYLMMEKNVSSHEIMAITFTNKAANEMKERLSSFGLDADSMWCCTIHSMCVRILRGAIDKLGYSKDFSIYDETDKDKVCRRLCHDAGIEDDKVLKSLKNYISEAKNRYMTPVEFFKERIGDPNAQKYRYLMEKYEDTLFRANALDFDDLLVKTLKLFTEYPEELTRLSERFRYIHVDEFQDTNRVQFLIVKMLSYFHGNLFVVGDDDQSIYGWRGAEIANILDFDKIFKDAKVYKLEQNYRSTKQILGLANRIIDHNKSRRGKELFTENEEGEAVSYYSAPDERQEAAFVATQIAAIHAQTNAEYRDFAVLMRLNAISRGIEQEFLKYGIPYRVYGGFKFFERKEVKDTLAYLKLMINPKDNEAFLRVVNCPKRGIGDKTVQTLLVYSAENGLSLLESLSRLDETDLPSSAKTKLKEFSSLISSLSDLDGAYTLSETVKKVVELSNIKSSYEDKSEESLNKLMNIDEFVSSAEEFEKDNQAATLSDFLSSVTLSSDTDGIVEEDAVSLATVHAVKGLEFPYVFAVGLEDGIFPITRAGDVEDEEEERRLMYVCVTRAEKRLCLTKAETRFLHGVRSFSRPSRFLKEGGVISVKPQYDRSGDTDFLRNGYSSETRYNRASESSVYSDERDASEYGYNSGYAKNRLQHASRAPIGDIAYHKYRSGVKVRHAKFGLGTVLVVQGEGASMVVDVVFEGVGVKKLAVKFAPMEVVDG